MTDDTAVEPFQPTILWVQVWDGPEPIFDRLGCIVTIADCGHTVWLSRAGRTSLDERPEMQTRCSECFDPDMDRASLRVPAGAIAAAAEALTAQQLADVRRWMNVHGVTEDES